jgi:hypothetical protein
MEGDDEDILATYARLTATPTKAQFTKQTGAEGLQVADTHSTKQNSKAVGGELQGGVMGSLKGKFAIKVAQEIELDLEMAMDGSADDENALLIKKTCTLQNTTADNEMRGVYSTQPIADLHSMTALHERSVSHTDKRSLI